ncbi:MAG: chemotaxis protein CheA [Spirochaetia bacterium]|jgi:two-component system chemotaxis sensor kinase CheA|nr:chemotaxis protein CheA [Spirochaetia bacterium]
MANKNLIDMLENFIPGDLISQLKIVDEINDLLEEDNLEIREKEILGHVAQKFKLLMKAGPEEDIVNSIKSLTSALSTSKNQPEKKLESINNDQAVIEDMEILASFISETNEHLENIETKIVSLENNDDPETVNEIFRSMHTIKGVASFLGLFNIKDLSHSLENLLDNLRDDIISIDTSLIDILLEGSDTLNQMMGELEIWANSFEDGIITEVFESKIEIHSNIEKIKNFGNDTKQKETILEDELITPEMTKQFAEESLELIEKVEHSILELEKDPENLKYIEESFRLIHTIKGNSGFFWFERIEKLCMGIETVFDSLRKKDKIADHSIISSLLSSIDMVRESLSEITDGKLVNARNPKIESQYHDSLGNILIDMGATTEYSIEEALNIQQKKLGEILLEKGNVTEVLLEKALKKQGKNQSTQASGGQTLLKKQDIRVSTERLDKLFNLVGELITAETMVIHHPELNDLELNNFTQALTALSKITKEMQEVTMAIRMIPLDGLFNKMRRLIRDLSKKFDKKVVFLVSGEDTEMDRNVIDQIADPLVHIIRNAVDHGVESSAERIQNGKVAEGTIKLNAKYEGNEIWISIIDDGGGLNRDRISEIAVERGLLSQEQVESKTNSEIWPLIFEPGFSTNEIVSEISGRGVGMDVVKKNIEKLRGKVEILSESQKGTTFILQIPLTLAILDGILFRSNDMLCSIPTTDIIEFHKPEAHQITTTSVNQQVLNLRDEIIPLIKLSEFYDLSTTSKDYTDGILIIATAYEKKIAILVDEIIGNRQFVIKALPEYLNNVKAVSGCSILGGGDVCLVIDTGAFISQVLE